MSFSTAVVLGGAAVDVAKDTVSAIQQFKGVIDGLSGENSLIGATAMARVEPLCLIDSDIMNAEYLPDALSVLQNVFAGYYLQAVQLMNTVGSVSVSKALGKFNPNRKVGFEEYTEVSAPNADIKDYKFKLPNYAVKRPSFGMEAAPPSPGKTNSPKDSGRDIYADTNLVTGKMYDVTIREGNNSATVPIGIRLAVTSMPTSVMVAIMSIHNKLDYDFVERYHAWRAGRIQFIRDLILCKDLIDKQRNLLIKDKTGIYAEILARQNSNAKAGVLNGTPSLATASNLAIISSDTAEQIEVKLSGKLDRFNDRQAIFTTTNLMILMVIDKTWEQVTMYYRGINASTKLSVKDLKSSKKDGADVNSILKAFIEGKAPL